MLLAILGGVSASSTFDRDASVNRARGYLTFILAFTAITNAVVCFFFLRFFDSILIERFFFRNFLLAVWRFDVVSNGAIDYWMMGRS